jgi:cyclophilin family peptidyl-prolyl cis-trans isomerase
MATEKRARKKLARDEMLAQREAAHRRRSAIRAAVIGGLILLVVGVVMFSGGGDKPEQTGAAGRDDPAQSKCESIDPPASDPQQYDSPPDLELESGVDYSVIVHTTCGELEMDLFEEKAPESVANFIFLAEEGFYDGLIWHRVESNSVVQTGDPDGQNGSEVDGPGYSIADEFPEAALEYTYGVAGMANAGPGTTGSQWFIVVHDPDASCDAKGSPLSAEEAEAGGEHCPAGFQPLYNIFAEVSPDSYETLQNISSAPTRGGNDPVEAVKPEQPIYITDIEVIEN